MSKRAEIEVDLLNACTGGDVLEAQRGLVGALATILASIEERLPAVVSPAQATTPVVERQAPPYQHGERRAIPGERLPKATPQWEIETRGQTSDGYLPWTKARIIDRFVSPQGFNAENEFGHVTTHNVKDKGETWRDLSAERLAGEAKCEPENHCPACDSFIDPPGTRCWRCEESTPEAPSAGADQQGEGDVTTENVQAVRGVDGGRLIDFMDAQLAAENDIRANVDRALARQRELHGALIASINVAHAEEVKSLKANIDRWGETYETLRQEYRSVVKERDDNRDHFARQAEAHTRELSELKAAQVKEDLQWQDEYDKDKREWEAKVDDLKGRLEAAERALGVVSASFGIGPGADVIAARVTHIVKEYLDRGDANAQAAQDLERVREAYHQVRSLDNTAKRPEAILAEIGDVLGEWTGRG